MGGREAGTIYAVGLCGGTIKVRLGWLGMARDGERAHGAGWARYALVEGLCWGWHELGWSLLRRVHLAARPGAVKDLRVRRGALAGCGPARVARSELVASATGMLVLGSLHLVMRVARHCSLVVPARCAPLDLSACSPSSNRPNRPPVMASLSLPSQSDPVRESNAHAATQPGQRMPD